MVSRGAGDPGRSASANVLVVDGNDHIRFGAVKLLWDPVRKARVRQGLVPLVQLNDIIPSQLEPLAITRQGTYYLCADDRMEAAGTDAIFRVSVNVILL